MISGQRMWIVTSTELGWDCIVAVYDQTTVTKEQLLVAYPKQDCYVIHNNGLYNAQDLADTIYERSLD